MIKNFYKRSRNSDLDKRELGWIWMNKRDLSIKKTKDVSNTEYFGEPIYA